MAKFIVSVSKVVYEFVGPFAAAAYGLAWAIVAWSFFPIMAWTVGKILRLLPH